jgi:hypothetical protein
LHRDIITVAEREGMGGVVVLYFREVIKKGVHDQDEEDGREWAALFDATGDGDGFVCGSGDGGGDTEVSEEAFDSVNKPLTHANVFQSFEKKTVRDAVKGFVEVDKEDVTLLFFIEGFVEELIEARYVSVYFPAINVAGLVG